MFLGVSIITRIWFLFFGLLQIDRISAIAAKYVGKPMGSSYSLLPPIIPSRSLDLGVGVQMGIGGEMFGGGSDLLRSFSGPSEADKPIIIELAVPAMEELIQMVQLGEPLWVPGPDGATEILSEDEYMRKFPRGIGPKPFGLKTEASRHSADVIMNHMNLVEILMDAVCFDSSPLIYLITVKFSFHVRVYIYI